MYFVDGLIYLALSNVTVHPDNKYDVHWKLFVIGSF